jgi:hypothetical protein
VTFFDSVKKGKFDVKKYYFLPFSFFQLFLEMTSSNINPIGLSPSSPILIPNVNRPLPPTHFTQQGNLKRSYITLPPIQQPERFYYPPPLPSTSAALKRTCVEMSDAQVNEIVEMLGTILVKVKQEISDKKGNYKAYIKHIRVLIADKKFYHACA